MFPDLPMEGVPSALKCKLSGKCFYFDPDTQNPKYNMQKCVEDNQTSVVSSKMLDKLSKDK